MLKKTLLVVLAFLFLFFPTKVSADEDFFVDLNVIYEIQQSGKSIVTFNITLENAGDELYASSYKLNLENIDAKNIKAFYLDSEIPVHKTIINENYYSQINFDDYVVGKGKSRKFTILFEENSFAAKTGEIWEISIPRLASDASFRSYNASLLVPKSFGNPAFISPDVQRTVEKGEYREYSFEMGSVSKTGISAGFGEFQIFSFIIKYHLDNPLNKEAPFEIALPPDTSFQKLYYQKIEPLPERISVDDDGNWLAKYLLKPRERLDIEILGNVHIFSSPRKLSDTTINPFDKNLEASEYWQIDDEPIKKLAEDYKTPRAIYDFVASNLGYDYDRVKPNVQRLGAVNALKNPKTAICMEFTDLFIAIARAAGIPAREINGYAYTENPEIQPLSLVADVLHAWPEYWDSDRNIWVPVDPTWASTTGGVDYFDKLDLRHFTFVIHGQSATRPYAPGSYKLGTNPQKDVFVTFGQLQSFQKTELQITADLKRVLPLLDTKILIKVKNPGPSARYNVNPKVIFDGVVVQESFIDKLLPYNEYEMQIFIPFSLLANKTPNEIKVTADNSEVSVPSGKKQVILINMISFSLIFISTILLVMRKSGKPA